MKEDALPWWAADFLRAAGAGPENGTRGLARGSVTIVPGEATALVEGRGFRPNRVRLRTSTFDCRKWDAFFDLFAGQALYPAALLAGYLPRSAKSDLARLGVRLVPSASRLSREPEACPRDAANTAIRLIAERFAEDPFHLLHFRGADRPTVFAEIARHWNAAGGESGPAIALDELEEILDRPPGAADGGSLLPQVQRAEAFRDDPILRANLARLYMKVAERTAAIKLRRAPGPAEHQPEERQNAALPREHRPEAVHSSSHSHRSAFRIASRRARK